MDSCQDLCRVRYQIRFLKAHVNTLCYASQKWIKLPALGIIKPIQFSDWTSPVVPVLKPDGSLRICGNHKVTVSQVAKLDTHPIPS